jgi:PAS domain S-box-containing protein
MDNSQEVICTVDESGRFLSINPACLELWGYTPAELIGRSYVDLVHPDDRPKTAEADSNTRKAGRLTDFVNRYVRKDGALVDVLWSATWSEADRIFFCVAHDVTQRQLAEEALREAKEEADRANRAKSEFLSRMSHELRTPLNAILGFGQLLEQQNPTETQRSQLGHITSAGRHLLGLINEVLDISRIEAGRLQLSLEPVCVNTALAETVDLMRPMAAERRVGLASPRTLDADTYVLADSQRLKQVLLNLLTNAIKYTGTGGDVTVCCDACAWDKIRIVVTDTGAGIPEEKLPRLFTPFDRLGAEQSDVQGTGLGLALSQRLMQAMNGEIGVTSVVGEGSTFWLELPRTTSPLELSPPRRSDNGVSRHYNPTAPKHTVLYIEDNSSNLILVEQILADEPDLELVTATSAKAGLELARQHIPDVILLDLHLPDLPGWNLLAQFKAEQTLRHIPVIVVSADATKRQRDRLRAAGAHAYLTKPIDVPEFRRVLRHSLGLTKDAKEPALCMT